MAFDTPSARAATFTLSVSARPDGFILKKQNERAGNSLPGALVRLITKN